MSNNKSLYEPLKPSTAPSYSSPPNPNPPHPQLAQLTLVESAVSPNLDCVNGLCCPIGTVYNHEHRLNPSTFLKYFVFGLEITFHLFALISQACEKEAREKFLRDHGYDLPGQDDDHHHHHSDHQDGEKEMEILSNLGYFKTTVFIVTSVFYGIYVLWQIFIRVYFFVMYKPKREKQVFDGILREEPAMKEVSWVAKLFFPLATVYYHEGNEIARLENVFAFLFGCFYTMICYKPRRERERATVRYAIISPNADAV